MKRWTFLFAFLVYGFCLTGQEMSGGTTHSDSVILALFEGLRVADVSDGMDFVGLRDVGLLETAIEPLWRDIDQFSHIFCGIAVTARYVPTNRPIQHPMPLDSFRSWEGSWYSTISPEPFVDSIKPGSALVLDVAGDGDTGSMGSFNGLVWMSRGARGVVSNGGVRDTDEVIKQKIPTYLDLANRGRGIRPGRNEIESVNRPVSVGGVLIRPGDVIVADGDGVICVPREYAVTVARYARFILDGDKAGRRALYEQLGMELDPTVVD